MKSSLIKTLIVLITGVLSAQTIRAQGTTYLSNLEQPSSGSIAVGSDQWLAEMFLTGSNPGGYFLSSFQLGIQNALGSPTNFTVMIYSAVAFAGIYPGSPLGSLSGTPSPITTGTYSYTGPAHLPLSPQTPYFIVVTAGTAVANDAYQWSLTSASSYNPIGGWAVIQDSSIYRSVDGSSWNRSPGIFAQFAINATTVPEPSILALSALGVFSFLWFRRHQRGK